MLLMMLFRFIIWFQTIWKKGRESFLSSRWRSFRPKTRCSFSYKSSFIYLRPFGDSFLLANYYANLKVKASGSITTYIEGVNKNNPFKDASLRSSQQYILKTMESLTESEHTIMLLYYFESKKLKEISGILGITESRVSQLHMRAKGKMRDWLEGEFTSYEDLVA